MRRFPWSLVLLVQGCRGGAAHAGARSAFDIDVEPHGAWDATFDHGDNRGGCPEASDSCITASANLAPPEPVGGATTP